MNYGAVVAFCESRIETLKREIEANPEQLENCLRLARRDELIGIVTLCKDLQETEDMLRKQLGLVETI